MGSNLFGSAEISLSEKGASDVKAQALTLLCRTLSHLQAVVLLTRERFVVEARTITRCCFENLFYVVARREHGDAFVKEMGLHESSSGASARPHPGDDFAFALIRIGEASLNPPSTSR